MHGGVERRWGRWRAVQVGGGRWYLTLNCSGLSIACHSGSLLPCSPLHQYIPAEEGRERTLGKSDEDMVREDEFPILKAGRSARYERPRTDAEEARMRVGREVERRVARRDVGLMRRRTRGGRRTTARSIGVLQSSEDDWRLSGYSALINRNHVYAKQYYEIKPCRGPH